MLEQMAEDADKPDLDLVEADLFGTLFGFHQRIMDLVRQSSLDKEKLKVVAERIKLVLQNVTNDMKRSKDLNLQGRLESAYEEVKRLVDAATVDYLDESVKANTKAYSSADTWFVYILRCVDGSLYTGITKDVSRRYKQHNAGTASRYTRSRLPVSVVYQESQATRSLALKREAAIKAMPLQKKESLMRSGSSSMTTCVPLASPALSHVQEALAKTLAEKAGTAAH